MPTTTPRVRPSAAPSLRRRPAPAAGPAAPFAAKDVPRPNAPRTAAVPVTESLLVRTPAAEPATKDLKPHQYGCLLAPLPQPLAKEITDWFIEHVGSEHLGPGGYEFHPHVTVLYGFTENTPATAAALRAFLADRPPLQIKLGGFASFPANEDGCPFYVGVEGEPLHALHSALAARFPNADKHPSYVPHVNVAYLDPAAVPFYLGKTAPFLHWAVTLDVLEYAYPDGTKEGVRLGGPAVKALSSLTKSESDDGNWRTIEGTHVHFDKPRGGEIDKGPPALVGKKPSELPPRKPAKQKIGRPRVAASPFKTLEKEAPAAAGSAAGAPSHRVYRVLDDKEVRGPDTLPDENLPDEMTSFVDKLTPDEKAGVDDYTNYGYRDVNKQLRQGGDLDEDARRIAAGVTAAIKKAGVLPEPITTWRGVALLPDKAKAAMDGFKRSLTSGESVTMSGFGSSSLDPQIAAGFVYGGIDDYTVPFIFEVRARKGVYVAAVPGRGNISKTEREYILPHGARYNVTGIKKIKFKNRRTGRPEARQVVMLEQLV